MMHQRTQISILLALVGCSFITHGFTITDPSSRINIVTALGVKKVKRQSLGSIAEDGMISTTKKLKNKSSGKSNKRRPVGDNISSDLTSWAASKKAGTETSAPVAVASVDDNNDDDDDVAGFVSFSSMEEDDDDDRSMSTKKVSTNKGTEKLVKKLGKILEENNNLEDILGVVKAIMDSSSTSSLKALSTGKRSINYRLAWVGGDDPICHLGTGLHKVPLARLQEVFLRLQGRSDLEMYEVISVLGPFPNVRNTLYGKCKVPKVSGIKAASNNDDSFSPWSIEWQSMIDGTGKEILPGNDKRIVNLDVHYADSSAIVAVMPQEDGKQRIDPLESNGANVLLFVREDEMDEKLEALRVL